MIFTQLHSANGLLMCCYQGIKRDHSVVHCVQYSCAAGIDYVISISACHTRDSTQQLWTWWCLHAACISHGSACVHHVNSVNATGLNIDSLWQLTASVHEPHVQSCKRCRPSQDCATLLVWCSSTSLFCSCRLGPCLELRYIVVPMSWYCCSLYIQRKWRLPTSGVITAQWAYSLIAAGAGELKQAAADA